VKRAEEEEPTTIYQNERFLPHHKVSAGKSASTAHSFTPLTLSRCVDHSRRKTEFRRGGGKEGIKTNQLVSHQATSLQEGSMNLTSPSLASLRLINLAITKCQSISSFRGVSRPHSLENFLRTVSRHLMYIIPFRISIAASVGLAIQDQDLILYLLSLLLVLQSLRAFTTLATAYVVVAEIFEPAETASILRFAPVGEYIGGTWLSLFSI
jgi:hypothetical protein